MDSYWITKKEFVIIARKHGHKLDTKLQQIGFDTKLNVEFWRYESPKGLLMLNVTKKKDTNFKSEFSQLKLRL